MTQSGEMPHTTKPSATWQTYSPSKSIHHVTKLPAFRDSLLYGMGAGAFAGLVRYYRRPNVLQACNWAVGSFLGVSAIMWFRCNAVQREKDIKVQHAVDLMNKREQKRAALKRQAEEKQSDEKKATPPS